MMVIGNLINITVKVNKHVKMVIYFVANGKMVIYIQEIIKLLVKKNLKKIIYQELKEKLMPFYLQNM